MKTILRILLFTVLLYSLAAACEGIPVIDFDLASSQVQQLYVWDYAAGADRNWAAAGSEDTTGQWVTLLSHRVPTRDIHWYRTGVRLSATAPHGKTLTIRVVGMPMAYEVYWDGHCIGKNGRIGKDKEEEQPGLVQQIFDLPEDLITAGEHTITIRRSNFSHKSLFTNSWVILSYRTDWQVRVLKFLSRQYLIVGIYGITFVVCLALYWGGGRHRSFLFFGVYCFLSALTYSVAPIIEHGLLNILWLEYLWWIQFAHFIITPILITLFVVYHFHMPRKWIIIGILIGITPLIRFLIPNAVVIMIPSLLVVIYTLGLTVYAIRQRKSGSIMVLLGLISVSVPIILTSLRTLTHRDITIIPHEYTNVLFIFFITLAISRQIREQYRNHTTTLRRSHRLETELLKKTIQPHFIMNTLLSIISLIGENPRKAVRLIKVLADEFRVINRISAEKLIPIDEEIDLCRTHLELMGYRLDAVYEFSVQGIDAEDTVPPMIFHTLVENALTHAYDAKENGRFTLACTRQNHQVHYQLRNDGSLLAANLAPAGQPIEEGLGFKYVRARLEESYPSKWTLDYGLEDGRWIVDIRVQK